MAQRIFPLMFALDWLSLSLVSDNEAPGLCNSELFEVNLREYGTKQYRLYYEVLYITLDGELEPFGIFQCEPTNESWKSNLCSLKLNNKTLYNDGSSSWLTALNIFLDTYNLRVANISRADIACDFLFLRNRISGPALVKRLKSHEWWKCGSVNCSEHFIMPYSLKWERSFGEDIYETEIYMHSGQMQSMTETLTFGTMSSDAQVCIYDKTRELDHNAVCVMQDDGSVRRVSHKEYIRDCHKMAGVWDEVRHTWRVEIRLKADAAFLLDQGTTTYRQLLLLDLAPEKLADTYRAAADRYFRIVDATLGDTRKINAELCASLRGHKNRLPQVHLFAGRSSTRMARRKYVPPATAYHRAVITRLEKLGDRMLRVPFMETHTEDFSTMQAAVTLLDTASKKQVNAHSILLQAKNCLNEAYHQLQRESPYLSPEQHRTILQCREVLERHLTTESPLFTRNMISTLSSIAAKLPMHKAVDAKSKLPPEVLPGDAAILSEAARILKGIFVTSIGDARREEGRGILVDSVATMLERLANSSNEVTHQDYLAAQFIFDNPSPPLSKEIQHDLLSAKYGLCQIDGYTILSRALQIYKNNNYHSTTYH